jgi:hypothetical protein
MFVSIGGSIIRGSLTIGSVI